MKEAESADINSRIAARVKALRSEQGLSLESLAAKCEVSRSMLSLIERGESSPTAVVLEKIATGLGVTLASLFDDHSVPADPLSRAVSRTTWKDPQTGYLRRNISPANFPSPLQIVEVVLPAGARVAYETGAREGTIHQQIWMQEGTVDLSIGRTQYRLSEDDCLAMKLDSPTTFHNPTRKRARYIVALVNEHARSPRR
ncbi:MAG TPA: XRE family transcriptional regulator [Steroidobacteraceae bacterium]|nr:XRE family transcriptional regulator [Steroidobacteraceae bacterium]